MSEYYDMYMPHHNDGNTHVLCAESALFRNGLSTQASCHLQMWTTEVILHDVHMPTYSLYYRYKLNKDIGVTPHTKYPWMLIPNKERALIDMISQKQFFNEGSLIEGLQEYLRFEDNPSKLYEMGERLSLGIDFFDATKEKIDYWIKEAEEDDYTCW